MAEPLKNLYTQECLNTVAEAIGPYCKGFDQQAFLACVFDHSWADKVLLQRMRHISLALRLFLPNDIEESLVILNAIVHNFTGFQYMFFPEFVAMYAIDDFELAMIYLEKFSPYSSSELAIRPFIIRYPEQTLLHMQRWAGSENEHIRRLASEGCRPRLPWAIALPAFKRDPNEILKVIKLLKDDDSEYVRRSVANNLNDISKDHPNITFNIAKQWLGQSKTTDKLIKHACRTLLKKGHSETLALFDFKPCDHIRIKDFEVQALVKFEEILRFSFELMSSNKPLGLCRLEFVIHFKKANGQLSPKVFKISEGNFQQYQKRIEKNFSFKAISTRRYYNGQHQLAIILNGEKIAQKPFTLKH